MHVLASEIARLMMMFINNNFYIGERLKLEGGTENMGVCTKEREGMPAEFLRPLPALHAVSDCDVCLGILFKEPNPTGSRPRDLIGQCRQQKPRRRGRKGSDERSPWGQSVKVGGTSMKEVRREREREATSKCRKQQR